MKFYIADAFTETTFGGNPAGVVILEKGQPFPELAVMVKTAAELRYSETAFLSPLDGSAFEIRYFTPAAEVDLCGHATIASFASLLDAELAQDDRDYTVKTRSGDLTVKLQNGFVMMEMASPVTLGTIREQEKLELLYSIMGIPFEPVLAACGCSQYVKLLPDMVSTGLPDIIMPVKNRETLNAISPDFPALSRLSEEYQVTGVHAFTLDREGFDVTAHCRNFAPLYDIDEEAATGTASGALTWYLFSHGLIPDQKECAFIQGEAMERPSKILTHIRTTDQSARIQVGGNAVIVARGEIFL
ncbi:MAG: PhzF family phenazine biosynthesis protein [Firmicutes bacterium]|jgi:PhzF family phenazine biosynthesis protein|nr:PhzF family phenazine biosynthesis protein [Bacillota bacterium]